MEHLSLPRYRPVKEQILIPYVCEKPYDKGEFLSYPIRENIRFAILTSENVWADRHEQHFPDSIEQVYSLLQTWLFFGLINEILGTYINADDLVRDNGAGTPAKVLSTSLLPDAVQRWVEDTAARPADSSHSYEHIALCLNLAFTNLKNIATKIDSEWVLQLASLGEMLCWAANRAYDVIADPVNRNQCPNQWHTLVNNGYWEELMTSSRLCPTQRSMTLKMASSVHTLYFTSHLIQPTPQEAHKECEEHICKANQINLREYRTRHVTDQCDCEHLSINSLDLITILKDGHLPLLQIRPDRTPEKLSVNVVSSKKFPRYLALSHVWADGLGNPVENALPRCQLNFLCKTVDNFKLYTEISEIREDQEDQENQEILLWCDTMCCPAEQGEGKDLALKELKRTYLEASYVLVLDSSLRHYDLNEHEIDEAAMRIFMSGWYRRLWTLQEAALSVSNARLWFYFEKSFVRIRTLFRGIRNEFSSVVSRHALASDLVERGSEMMTFHDPSGEGIEFESIADGLHYRSVTVQADEPLLIGNLLGLNVASILECSSHPQRMQRMWSLMPQSPRGIPRAIIFWVGPRLGVPGFKWAPATVLFHSPNNSLSEMDPDGVVGLLTDRGLRVAFPGYLSVSLPRRSRLIQHIARNVITTPYLGSCWARRDEGNWYNLLTRTTKSPRYSSPRDALYRSLSMPNLRLIHASLPPTRLPPTRWDSSESIVGILAEETDIQDDMRFVQKLTTVFLSRQSRSNATVLEAAHHATQELFRSDIEERLSRLVKHNADIDVKTTGMAIEIMNEGVEGVVKEIDQSVFTVADQIARHGMSEVRGLVWQMFLGNYCCLGRRSAETQLWCVD